nr:hypothetical protein [Tanacetum cinerariifolium]
MINDQVGDLSSYTTKYTSPALIQKVFANIRRVGKGFSRVNTPLFDGMLVLQQVHDDVAVDVDDAKTTPLLPIPATTPPTQQELILSSSQVESNPPPSPHQSPIAQPSSPLPQQPHSHDAAISMDLLNQLKMHPNRGKTSKLDADEDVTLEEVAKDADVQGRLEESQTHVYHLDLEHAQKVLSMQDDEAEPAELKEVIEVVTTAKLMTEVVTAAAATITVAPMPKASAARRRKSVVIRDPEETATLSVIMHYETKSKDKGKGILVEEPKPLKRQAQIEQDEAYAKELKAELNANINWNEVIEQHFNSIVDFLEKEEKELEEEASNQSKKKSETSEEKATKNIWKNQRGRYRLAKVKSWKLLESCRVHIITFTTTQMILLVERRYPLTRFTLDQMLNNVRLEVEEESEVSLELLRFVRRQQQEGYKPE